MTQQPSVADSSARRARRRLRTPYDLLGNGVKIGDPRRDELLGRGNAVVPAKGIG